MVFFLFFMVTSVIVTYFCNRCPAPGCANAVKCDLKSEWEVYCTCGYKFCFRYDTFRGISNKVHKKYFIKRRSINIIFIILIK